MNSRLKELARTADFDARLESLRGFAALAVVLLHATVTLPVDGETARWMTPIEDQTWAGLALSAVVALTSAGSAVVVFFVLSGYVLALSRFRSPVGGVLTYLVRRSFRLLPPMWLSIGVMWLLLRQCKITEGAHGSFTQWFTTVYAQNLTRFDVWNNALLLDNRVNPVTWTMFVEALGSVFVLCSVALAGASHIRRALLILICTVGLAVYFPRDTKFIYLVCFQAGIVLAMCRNRPIYISPWILTTAALALFQVERFQQLPSEYGHLAITTGAALMVASVTRGAFTKFWQSRPLRFLGRISYSLYLLHLPVLYATGLALVAIGLNGPGLMPHALVIVIGTSVSLLAAWAAYTWVEKPSIVLGSKFK